MEPSKILPQHPSTLSPWDPLCPHMLYACRAIVLVVIGLFLAL